jgi:nucleotidyltransferase/DNA polymerase involved in DNA repair
MVHVSNQWVSNLFSNRCHCFPGLSHDIPLGVQQWQSLIAVNYASRKFGVSRMDKITDGLSNFA